MAERQKDRIAIASRNLAEVTVALDVAARTNKSSEGSNERCLTEKKGRRRPARRGRPDGDGFPASPNAGGTDAEIGSIDNSTWPQTFQNPCAVYMPKITSKSCSIPFVTSPRPPTRLFHSISDLPPSSSSKVDASGTSSRAPGTPIGSNGVNPGFGGRMEYASSASSKGRFKESSPVQTTKPKWKETAKLSKAMNDCFQKQSMIKSHVDLQKATLDEKSGDTKNCRRTTNNMDEEAERSSGEMLESTYWLGPNSNPYSAASPLTSSLKDKGSGKQKFRRGGDMQADYYQPYLPLEEVNECLKAGCAFRGKLRVNMHNRNEAYISLEGIPIDILIDGLCAQNRAIDGDVVAVSINPVSFWPKPRGLLNKQKNDARLAELLLDSNSELHSGVQESSHEKRYDSVEMSKQDFDVVPGIDKGSLNPVSLSSSTTTSSSSSSPFSSVGSGSYSECSTACLVIDRERNETKETYVESKGPENVNDMKEPMLRQKECQLDAVKALDVLATQIALSPNKRPTGEVLAILERSPRREAVAGFLEMHQQVGNRVGTKDSYSAKEDASKKMKGKVVQWNNLRTIMLLPSDTRFPKMAVSVNSLPDSLRLRVLNGDPTVSGELVAARISDWRADSFLPYAVVTQCLGQAGEIEAQTAGILFEYAIHSAEFPQAVLDELPELPWKIPSEEFFKRKDLRQSRVFTIDPPTARDLDDALSIEFLSNDRVRIGVHIADVSFFVHPATALDKEAQDRSTSVYLIQRVLPMLPPVLCEELCSLNPGVDRLAFSVIWDISLSGEVIDHWIGRTVINSCCKLTYGHVQEMIDDTSRFDDDYLPELCGGFDWNEVTQDVRVLHEIAKKRRASRFEAGALRLDNMKLIFTLDEDGVPYDSAVYEHKESNLLVEEFMLLANMTVAKVISRAFPDCALLRRHPEPNARKLKELQEFCSKNGFEIDVSSAGALHESLQRLLENLKDDPALCSILTLYAAKSMQLAKYFCTGEQKDGEYNWNHYALATSFYTHFTSPIRRYADIVVHRTLAAVLEAEEILSETYSSGTMRHEFMDQERDCLIPESISKIRCFTGPTLDKEVMASLEGQKALTMAACKLKVPCCKEVAMMAEYCNERKLASRNVKDATDRLYLWAMLKKKQGILSDARVLALGPKFVSVYVRKIAMERRIYYDEIEGLRPEWFEATGTLVLDIGCQNDSLKKFPQVKQRTFSDVALLVNPADTSNTDLESYMVENVLQEVQETLEGRLRINDEMACSVPNELANEVVEPAVLPLTLRILSSVPVFVYAVGGHNGPLDIAVRFYLSSYLS